MKVLLVDDERAIRLTLEAQLIHLGHEVVAAPDTLQAWCAFESALPGVVITDLVMPGGSGADLCRRIRSSQRVRYTYIIVLTSMGGRSQYRAAMEAGADDFLPKPCTQDDIAVRLRVAERVLRLQRHVHTLEGFLPICSYCRQIRDTANTWQPLGQYVAGRTSLTVEDALCPACAATA
jgi:DNA-binding response OmpR family regulator